MQVLGEDERWARVVDSAGGAGRAGVADGDGFYIVEYEDGTKEELPRRVLRWRNQVTIAFAFASGDRKHDTHAVQHFMVKQQEWLKLNVPEERFTKMFVRSDNAASHFKSKYTLRFLSFFKSLYSLAHVVWDFGCPGHGKGPWDGIAGMLKSWLRRTALTHSMDKVDRGPKDCADRLRAHFETDAWRAAHDAPKYKIKRVVVDWTGEGDIKRPSHWECGAGGTVVHAVRSTEVAPLKGVSENYSYCMLRPGFVGVRRHTCWCKACLGCGRALEGGTATAPTARVDGCASEMRRVHLELTDAAGARRTRTMRFNDGESIARDLKDKEGTVFACATPARGYQDEFELFVAAKGPRGHVIETLRADQTINGINFKKGRLLVYCHDLARVHDDPARRTFELEPTLRAVEARMVRKTGVALDDAGDAPTPADTPRTGLSAAFAAVDGRLVVLSEAENAKTVAACDG